MPKVVDHDIRREEVLTAACRAIARLGIEGTTTREIAAEAGCSTGILAHYFDDKQEILLSAFRLVTGRAVERVTHRARDTGRSSPLGRLREVIVDSLPTGEDRLLEWKVWLAYWGYAVGKPEFALEHQRRIRAYTKLLSRMLKEAVKAGELPGTTDTDWEAQRIVVLVDGLGVQALFDGSRIQPRRQLKLVDDLLRELGARPADWSVRRS